MVGRFVVFRRVVAGTALVGTAATATSFYFTYVQPRYEVIERIEKRNLRNRAHQALQDDAGRPISLHVDHPSKLPSLLSAILHYLRVGVFMSPVYVMYLVGALTSDTFWFRDAAARMFVQCLYQCGPTFIKLGQWLSSRRDLFNQAVCDALSRLHEDVPQSFSLTEEDVETLSGALGDHLEVDTSPVGLGCVAQVYQAHTEHGRKVAIKVRRPNITEQIRFDIALLGGVCRVFEAWRPDLRWISLLDGLESFGYYLKEQVDFTTEAENFDKLALNFAHHRYVTVPEVLLCSPSLLVTEYIEAPSLSEIVREGSCPTHVRKGLWNELGQMISQMVLLDNLIHQDLHPGNIKVYVAEGEREGVHVDYEGDGLSVWQLIVRGCSEPLKHLRMSPFESEPPFKIYLLDAGLAIRITDVKRELFRDIVAAGLLRDPAKAGHVALEAHERLGLAVHGIDKEGFQKKAGEQLVAGISWSDNWQEWYSSLEDYKKSSLAEYFQRLIQLFSHHRIRMDPEIWQVMASFLLIEGSMRELNGSADVLQCVAPFLVGPLPFFHSLRTRLFGSTESIRPAGAVN